MPYTIPSSLISPGAVYQPRQIPAVVSQNARALYYTRGGSTSSSLLLDQSSLNSGTRRTGEEGRCYTADGTDDEVNFGNIGSAIWFSGWVRLNSDNQCLFSLSNDTNTNLIVSAGVLTAGATLTLTGIKIDDVSKTASEAGALLNDNAWHFLSCGIGDGLGGGSTADDVRFFTDGTAYGSVSGFDWRFWSTTPTAAELTEVYSGESPSRNSAALSKYALWAKCDEQSGTVAYDSSGNGNNGTLTNITSATFHATQDIWSFQNQVGFNEGRNLIKDSLMLASDWSASNITTTSGINDPEGASNAIKVQAINTAATSLSQLIPTLAASSGYHVFSAYIKKGSSATNFGYLNLRINSGPRTGNIATGLINFDTGVLTVIGNANADGRATDVGDGWYLVEIYDNTIVAGDDIRVYVANGGGISSAGIFAYFYAPQLEVGTQRTATQLTGNYYLTKDTAIPRDESDPTNDVLGNPLANTGRRPNDAALHSSNCLTADGTLYIAAAHLAGTETVVSSGGTSTPSISAGRIDFTAGTCWDLTLSDGTHYKFAEGYGTEILDASGNGNHGVLTSAVLANAWGATQNEYHSNLIDGSGKRMYFDGASNYLTIGTGIAESASATVVCDFYIGAGVLAGGLRTLLDLGGTSADGLVLWSNYSGLRLQYGNGVTTTSIVTVISEVTLYRAIITWNGSDIKLYLNGSLIGSGSNASLSSLNSYSQKIGYSSSTRYHLGSAWNVHIYTVQKDGSFITNFGSPNSKITDSTNLKSKYNGYGNTNADWIDTSGNGNDGTVVGSPEAFYIPAAPNGLDVFGNELTEKPSDATRNRAETLIDFDPDSTPEMGATQLGITVPASHAFGDAFAASTQIFSRQRTLTEDRFVVMPEAQTGSALATIQRYTQP